MAFARADYSATFLARYERRWWQTLGREIRAGALFRRISEKLSDADMDRIFRIVRSDGILNVASKKLRFDWHRELIFFALKHPLLGWALKKNGRQALSFSGYDNSGGNWLSGSE
jgi:flavin-dependent dehydrogenase